MSIATIAVSASALATVALFGAHARRPSQPIHPPASGSLGPVSPATSAVAGEKESVDGHERAAIML